MLQHKMQEDYLKFKIFTFVVFAISLHAMEDLNGLQELGFESSAEQFSLIIQKNNETIFENIDLPYSHFFPTPLYASVVATFYGSFGVMVYTYIDRSNGFLKNWAIFSLGCSTVYPMLPFVFVDSLAHLYNFIQFKKNKTSIEHTENLRIRKIDNNKAIISTAAYLNHFKTSCKIESLLWNPGILVARQTFMSSDYNWYEKNKINFNKEHSQNENSQDLEENDFNNIIEADGENVVAGILDNIMDTVISTKKNINGRDLIFRFFLNETTRIVYTYNYNYDHIRQYFLYNILTQKLYPFLPAYNAVDVQMTPDKTALIAITYNKTIKIDLTKDLHTSKQQLEKELLLKKFQEKSINLIKKSVWIILFLGYSQWWFKYFCKIDLYYHAKNLGYSLKKSIPSLILVSLNTIKNIKNIKFRTIAYEFLFGTLHE